MLVISEEVDFRHHVGALEVSVMGGVQNYGMLIDPGLGKLSGELVNKALEPTSFQVGQLLSVPQKTTNSIGSPKEVKGSERRHSSAGAAVGVGVDNHSFLL